MYFEMKNSSNLLYLLAILSLVIAFQLRLKESGDFLGIIDNLPKLVDKEHATEFIQTTHKNHKSTLCVDRSYGMCLFVDRDNIPVFNRVNAEKFYIVENEDGSISILHNDLCLVAKGTDVVFRACKNYSGDFFKVYSDDMNKNRSEDQVESLNPRIPKEMIFNYGIEDTQHQPDSIIKMKESEANYTLVPRKRHHNSHTHRVGGFGNKAYYIYYSHHPSSRYSQYSFHGYDHGIPYSWKDESRSSPMNSPSSILKL